MEVLPILSVLLAVILLPGAGYWCATRFPGATLEKRPGGAIAGGSVATVYYAIAAGLSDPDIQWNRHLLSFTFPLFLAGIIGLIIEGMRLAINRRATGY
jgi:hypothetical protein